MVDSLRNQVGTEHTLNGSDTVLELQFALLEAAQNQFIRRRGKLQLVDRSIQVTVFDPQFGQQGMQAGSVVRERHVAILGALGVLGNDMAT